MSAYSYDRLPYPVVSHAESHIRRLEAVATLFGMRPRPIADCRVLELGCAAGGNLIPQAVEFSQSEFLGVELSERQVAQGQSIVATLGLGNIELRRADLLDVDCAWGQFDYILCHGVYSWVSANVQQKILAICKDNLAPSGVALVSYNVLPGWHFRGAIRDMMLYHVSQFDEPAEQVSQARALLDFMVENCSADSSYGQMLRDELEIVRRADDRYLYHDHLEDHNDAIYFHQFVERAEAKGLQYLADTNVASMSPKRLPRKARNALASASLVKQEQYLDFLRNNAFRTTLLCHHGIELTRRLERGVLRKFQVTLAMRPEPFEVRFDSQEPLVVRMGPGTITTSQPVAMAVLEYLSKRWPRPIAYDELRAATVERLATRDIRPENVDAVSADAIAGALMDIFAAGLLDYYVHPPAVANVVSSRPTATRLARLQASSGSDVTNQRHENVALDEFSRYLTTLLDSHHDRSMLADEVRAAIAKGDFAVRNDRRQVQCVDPATLDRLLDSALTGICQASLLMA